MRIVAEFVCPRASHDVTKHVFIPDIVSPNPEDRCSHAGADGWNPTCVSRKSKPMTFAMKEENSSEGCVRSPAHWRQTLVDNTSRQCMF